MSLRLLPGILRILPAVFVVLFQFQTGLCRAEPDRIVPPASVSFLGSIASDTPYSPSGYSFLPLVSGSPVYKGPTAVIYQASGRKDTGGEASVWGTGTHRSYLIPAIEVPSFILALNLAARVINPNDRENGKLTYTTTPSTFFNNVVHENWVFDKDSFETNQLRHAYQGSVYHGFARSSGLGFWPSLGYTFAGSYLWETGGETTKPSINDQIMSGIAGAILGEPLFRIASLMLENGGEHPGFWNELGAAFVSPPTGFNRLVFGERFSPVFPSHDPARFWRVDLGGSAIVDSTGHVTGVARYAAVASFSMLYGLPGKPGYSYERPFDYFEIELAVDSGPTNVPRAAITRGLLFGSEYESGDTLRGIWGLYGSYEYMSPHTFRVSTAAFSIGTTAQVWLSRKTALQFSAMAGGGYGAAGTVPGAEPDYRHGGAAQGLLSLRLILGDSAMIELGRREYYICQFGSGKPPGNELMGRTEAGLTVRLSGRNAVSLHFLSATRDEYKPHAHSYQKMNTITLSYTILSDERFGAVQLGQRGR